MTVIHDVLVKSPQPLCGLPGKWAKPASMWLSTGLQGQGFVPFKAVRCWQCEAGRGSRSVCGSQLLCGSVTPVSSPPLPYQESAGHKSTCLVPTGTAGTLPALPSKEQLLPVQCLPIHELSQA